MCTVPPTPPRDLSFTNLQPFSIILSWNPPEDTGGDSTSTYQITLTNETVTAIFNTSELVLQLSKLQPSTIYTVGLVAINEFGPSHPDIVGVFQTADTGEWGLV